MPGAAAEADAAKCLGGPPSGGPGGPGRGSGDTGDPYPGAGSRSGEIGLSENPAAGPLPAYRGWDCSSGRGGGCGGGPGALYLPGGSMVP